MRPDHSLYPLAQPYASMPLLDRNAREPKNGSHEVNLSCLSSLDIVSTILIRWANLSLERGSELRVERDHEDRVASTLGVLDIYEAYRTGVCCSWNLGSVDASSWWLIAETHDRFHSVRLRLPAGHSHRDYDVQSGTLHDYPPMHVNDGASGYPPIPLKTLHELRRGVRSPIT